MLKAILQFRFVSNNFAYEKQFVPIAKKREKLLLLWITQNLILVYTKSHVESMTFHHVFYKRAVEIVNILICIVIV